MNLFSYGYDSEARVAGTRPGPFNLSLSIGLSITMSGRAGGTERTATWTLALGSFPALAHVTTAQLVAALQAAANSGTVPITWYDRDGRLAVRTNTSGEDRTIRIAGTGGILDDVGLTAISVRGTSVQLYSTTAIGGIPVLLRVP
jgi:hypothetical protein